MGSNPIVTNSIPGADRRIIRLIIDSGTFREIHCSPVCFRILPKNAT